MLLLLRSKLRDGNLSFQQCDHQEEQQEKEAQQLVTHFLPSRQEPEINVLAFFASSIIPCVFNKEVDPNSENETFHSF